jgi:heme-degrading monooxygenase HmoA
MTTISNTSPVIARLWHGRTRPEDAERYAEYLEQTGVPPYRATRGNLGVTILRRVTAHEAEFLVLSFWDSFEAVRRFAGDDPDRAVYYPEDARYLLEMEPGVAHFVVTAEVPAGRGGVKRRADLGEVALAHIE